MFQTLSQNLIKIFDKIRSSGVLTESQIDSAARDIRIALLEADVALPAVKDFIDKVKERAKGREIIKSTSPAQMVIKIIHDELAALLSPSKEEASLNLRSEPPVNIMIAGLQGSGKTTAAAKLALKLKTQNMKILLVSLDIYRPAAQEQLSILANNVGVDCLPVIPNQTPFQIADRAIKEAKLSAYDAVIYDTAGRLHIDAEMIEEVTGLKHLIKPTETLLVVDSMIGQDALAVAGAFDQKLGVSGIILSRIDGDGRGGAALSIRYVTGKPIKFLSVGEKPEDFEVFDANRIASRILDMGDVVSLVEKAAALVDQEAMEKAAAKLKKGKFDLDDYIAQIKLIRKMGGLGSMMSMIPGIGRFTDKMKAGKPDDKILISQEAIIYSMTKKERKNPDILNASRKKRIADGSGTSVQQINVLLKQYKQIGDMMKRASKIGPKALLRGGLGKLFS